MNLHEEIEKKANLWIMKENEGLNQEEQKQLDTWLQNNNYKEVYEENKSLISECLDLDDDFIKQIENEVLEEQKEEKVNFFYKTRYIAASIILTCFIVFAAFEVNNYFKPSFSQNYQSFDKKILNIALPDKSFIDLDIKSQVKVTYYKDKRFLELIKGKALFSVSKNKQRPFLVKSNKALVEVLGTKFEVVNIGKSTVINVLEGLVRVNHILDSGKKKALVQLKANDTFSLNSLGKVLNQGKIKLENIATWKNDILHFEKTTLAQASKIFQRYSNQKLEFETYELSQLKISGKFLTSHYQGFLDSIELIYPVKIQKNKDSIKIIKK